jgi:RimJ/RimL family protein N-acetyltransferase
MKNFRLVRADYESNDHLGYLYSALIRRLKEPSKNISHTELPTWEDHVRFLKGLPYQIHYLLETRTGHKIGIVYITREHEIGIYIEPMWRGEGTGAEALKRILALYELHYPEETIKANVALGNTASVVFFLRHGFVLTEEQEKQFVLERAPSWGRSDATSYGQPRLLRLFAG